MPGFHHTEKSGRLDEVMALLRGGRGALLRPDVEPDVFIKSVERRPYSLIARVGLAAAGVRKDLYVKIPHDSALASGASVRREFEVMSFFFERFAQSKRFRVVKPVAYFEDPPALVTEEASGEPFDAVFRSKGSIVKSMLNLGELSLYCGNCGEWLRALQSVPVPESGLYRVEETAEFMRGQISRCLSAGLVGKDLALALGACVNETSRLAAGSEVRLTWMHSDFVLSNILIDGAVVCVLDFSGMQAGPACRDVATFLYSLDGFLGNPLFRPRTVRALKEAFLKGYGWDGGSENAALFRLFEIRESLGGLLQLSARLNGGFIRTVLYRRLQARTTARLNAVMNTKTEVA